MSSTFIKANPKFRTRFPPSILHSILDVDIPFGFQLSRFERKLLSTGHQFRRIPVHNVCVLDIYVATYIYIQESTNVSRYDGATPIGFGWRRERTKSPSHDASAIRETFRVDTDLTQSGPPIATLMGGALYAIATTSTFAYTLATSFERSLLVLNCQRRGIVLPRSIGIERYSIIDSLRFFRPLGKFRTF